MSRQPFNFFAPQPHVKNTKFSKTLLGLPGFIFGENKRMPPAHNVCCQLSTVMGRYLIALITSNDCCVGLCNGLKWIWDHFYKTSCILHYEHYSLMMYKSCCRNAFNHSPHLNVTEPLRKTSPQCDDSLHCKKWLFFFFLHCRFYGLYIGCHYFACCKSGPLSLKVHLVTSELHSVCFSSLHQPTVW